MYFWLLLISLVFVSASVSAWIREVIEMRRIFQSLSAVCLVALLAGCSFGRLSSSGAPIKIGLIAPLSGGSATSGEAIQRGMLLAIDDVNRAGGVLGRPLALVARDVPNDRDAGVAALQELIDKEQIVTVFGGLFSPVMMAQLDLIHERRIPLINPWGSLTAITDNGHSPNYAFRVSVSDKYADEFLTRYALNVIGAHKPAIIADTSSWGDSNVAGLTEWLTRLNKPAVAIERFAQGDTDMRGQIQKLQASGADAILMIANAPEGATIVRGVRIQGWQVPIISHWGISGGKFVEMAGVQNVNDIFMLQTYSFYGQLSPQAQEVVSAYHARFNTRTVDEITAPVGVAHGYDGMRLLALAIQQAGTTDGPKIREALENLQQPYDGLVKQYRRPFSPTNHDALIANDYLMMIWQNGKLTLASQSRLTP